LHPLRGAPIRTKQEHHDTSTIIKSKKKKKTSVTLWMIVHRTNKKNTAKGKSYDSTATSFSSRSCQEFMQTRTNGESLSLIHKKKEGNKL
jgi:hypothetical protein